MSSPDSITSPLEAPAAAQPTPTRSSPTTFKRLFLDHVKMVEPLRYTRTAIGAHLWHTRRFLAALGLSERSDPICLIDEEKYKQALDTTCQALGYDLKSANARTLRAGVNRVRTTFLLLHDSVLSGPRSADSFTDFWSAYQYYGKIASRQGFLGCFDGNLRRPRKPTGCLLRNMGIREQTVAALQRGIPCAVRRRNEERFAAVEKLLRTPPGALVRHITFRGGAKRDPDRMAEHSSRYSQALRFCYCIAMAKWPQHLQDEVDEFIKDKKKTKWTVRSDGYCGTEDVLIARLTAFVGWLCLPTGENVWRAGAGRKLEDIKSVFAALVTPATLDRYAEFVLAHTVTENEFIDGERAPVFNGTLRGVYHFAAELLKPPHKFKPNRPAGFVFRNPGRYAPLLTHLLPTSSFNAAEGRFQTHETLHDRWIAFCQATRGAFFDLLDSAGQRGKTGKSRSTEAGIEQILALPDPRVAVAELLQLIRRDYEGYSWEATPHDRAFFCRRQLFFELMAIVPHRIRLWSVLTRRNFEERTNGAGERCFHLYISKSEFKNHRFIKDDYNLDIPARLTPLIDLYFSRAWPILNAPIGTFRAWREQNSKRVYQTDAAGNVVPIDKDARYADFPKMRSSDRVFGLAFGSSLKAEQRRHLTPKERTLNISGNLQQLCRRTTGRFLGVKYKTNGFYPHAFRHIIATAEIKNTGSYERAALLLWDSVEMVMKAYSHVKRTDLLAKVVESNEALFSQTN